MDLAYIMTPFLAWLIAGGLKFLVNSVRSREFAYGLIGYGGFPSNHSAIVSSMAVLVALREGLGHPAFGVALTLAFVVLLDANGLRRHVGRQAESINRLNRRSGLDGDVMREIIGHTKVEIGGGVFVGACVAVVVNKVSLGFVGT